MSFAKVQTDIREVNQLQSNIATTLDPILNNPLSSGKFLNGVALSAGFTTVVHNLGYQLTGWLLTGINGASTVYSTGANASTLTLVSSAAVTVNIYVF